MRVVMVAVALALLTAPSYAQMTQTTARSDSQKKADAEADKAYKTMIKNVPDKPRNADPWADARETPATSNNSDKQATAAVAPKKPAHQTSNKKPK
jgi:hypothetical protein